MPGKQHDDEIEAEVVDALASGPGWGWGNKLQKVSSQKLGVGPEGVAAVEDQPQEEQLDVLMSFLVDQLRPNQVHPA